MEKFKLERQIIIFCFEFTEIFNFNPKLLFYFIFAEENKEKLHFV